MISNTAQTNTFIGGMNMDMDVAILPDNQYRYAENIRIVTNDSGTTGAIQNIEGVKEYIGQVPAGETIIGTTVINDIAVIVTRLDGGINKVYAVDGFNTNTPTQRLIFKGQLNLCKDLDKTPNISIVGNYETDTNIKVYFTDGESSVKVLNIVDGKYTGDSTTNPLLDTDGNVLNPLAIDITPGAILPPFAIIDLTSGNLPAGVVQYCYQLFNLHNSESTLSALSEKIHLTQSSTSQDTQDIKGTRVGITSSKACRLTAPFVSKDFEKCRIIRILYEYNNQAPVIDIVNEIDVMPGQTSIEYTDTGDSTMGNISIEEFNALTGYQFIAATITKMSNRLFAADIKEDTWNPEYYDARAYRCNASGQLLLQSSNPANNISILDFDNANLYNIPRDHDCINPYNLIPHSQSIPSNRYAYGRTVNGTRAFGGSGINIDYNFVTVPLYMSDTGEFTSAGFIDDNVGMNVSPSSSVNSVTITNVGLGTSSSYVFPYQLASRQINYADPYIASRFKGYQRDEVYRFGIIFYNDKNLPSPVYWIGDIRMPHATDTGFEPFYKDGTRLMAKALGIKFTVKNVPDGTTGFEIVRCDRTEADRTVLMQSAVSAIYEYRILETGKFVAEGSTLETSVQTRSTPSLTYANYDYGYRQMNDSGNSYDWGYARNDQVRKDYVKLVSPEICIQQENMEKYFSDSYYIDTLYMVSSKTDPRVVKSGEYQGSKYDRYFAMASTFTNVDGKEEIVTESSKDHNHFGPNVVYDGKPLYVVPRDIPYAALISKYYQFVNMVQNQVPIVQAKFPMNIPYNAAVNVSPYSTNIGEITYTNWNMTDFTNAGMGRQAITGPGGPCLIAHAPGIYTAIERTPYSNPINNTSTVGFTSVPIANIKRYVNQYGGNTYSARQNSVYISTNSYVRLTSTNYNYTHTFSGDVYLGILDYPVTMIFQGNDINDYKFNKRYIGAYIPFETSINLNLLMGDMPHMTWRSGDNYLDSHMLVDITQRQTYHIQDEPFYVYNSVYSSQDGSRKFVPNSIYAEDNMRVYNRILASQAKTSNEILDNWTQFKIADYLDVDNQYGDITNLRPFKDRLMYWQRSAVGVAAVNERALINDGNIGQLTLGTGEVLSRFDYITTTNGSSITNDRSIVNSDNVLYWYDFDKNEICAYDSQVHQISKDKQVQSYLNEMYDKKRAVTLGLFDKKYNEIWFKFYDKSLIFSEQIGAFTSFYTFNPEWALQFSDKVVAIKNNKYYVINSLDIDGLGDVDKKAKIQFVVNKDVQYTKVFDNIRLQGDFRDQNNKQLTSDIIEYLKFGTKHQTSTLDNNIVFDYREDTYRLPIPRQDESNEQVSLSYPARMRGKYLICDYTFDSNNEHTFKIPYITTTYRYSLI